MNFQSKSNYFVGSIGYDRPNAPDSQTFDSAKVLVTAGILQGVAMFLQKATRWFGNKLMQGKEFAPACDIQRVADEMVKGNGLDVDVRYIDEKNIKNAAKVYGEELLGELATVARGENAFYADEIKLAVAPKSKPSMILHELGHAINAQKGKFLRFLQKSRGFAAAAPTILLGLSELFKRQDGKKNFVERNAGLLGFAAFLPTIVEEGMASLRGLKAAKTLGNLANLKCLKRNYFFAWMTYVIAGLGLGVAAKQAFVENGK